MEFHGYLHLLGLAGTVVFVIYRIGQFVNLKQAKKTRKTWGQYFKDKMDDFGILLTIGQLLILGQQGVSNLAVFLGVDAGLLKPEVQEGVAYILGILGTVVIGRLWKIGKTKIENL